METKKIPISSLLGWFQRMHNEHWPYVWGMAKQGVVDCSGAFVFTYRQFGRSIYHGSNRIARMHVTGLRPITGAVLQPGMAAFKTRNPGHRSYALPAEYRKGGKYYDKDNPDLLDYYHIGLVDADTRYVLNAQSVKTGFVRSKVTENWSHVAWLNEVEVQHTDLSGATVSPTNLKAGTTTVNLRAEPREGSKILLRVKQGEQLQCIKDDSTWAECLYQGVQGFVMRNYVQKEW